MKYAETKKKIDAIRNKNEVMFRMAISHLMDVGIRHLTEENIAETCDEIMKEDDSRSFMTNGYKCELIKTAGELAKLDHIHVLTYISHEVTYDVGDNAEWFGKVRWCENDLKSALEENGYPATENNIANLYSLCDTHWFTDHMIEAGWEYINEQISYFTGWENE